MKVIAISFKNLSKTLLFQSLIDFLSCLFQMPLNLDFKLPLKIIDHLQVEYGEENLR